MNQEEWDIIRLERVAIGYPIDADDNESAIDARQKLMDMGRWSDDLEARHQKWRAERKAYNAQFQKAP